MFRIINGVLSNDGNGDAGLIISGTVHENGSVIVMLSQSCSKLLTRHRCRCHWPVATGYPPAASVMAYCQSTTRPERSTEQFMPLTCAADQWAWIFLILDCLHRVIRVGSGLSAFGCRLNRSMQHRR